MMHTKIDCTFISCGATQNSFALDQVHVRISSITTFILLNKSNVVSFCSE